MKKVFVGLALAAMLLLSSCRTIPGSVRTKKTYANIDSRPQVTVIVEPGWLEHLHLHS